MRIILYISLLFLIITACSSNTSNDEGEDSAVVSTGYFYYPKHNIYFDTSTKKFIFFDSSTTAWRVGELPAALYADLGKAALITNPVQPVWTDNKNHRFIYSATLYADSSDLKNDQAKKKGVENPSVQESAPEGKKKTKVGRFLQKVFGKKKESN